MEQLIERINAVKRQYGCSGRGFAQAVNLKPAAVINYLSGRQAPSLEFVLAILRTYKDVSAEWLLRGEGMMLKSESVGTSESEQKLRSDVLVKEGIIQELRTIILQQKQQD